MAKGNSPFHRLRITTFDNTSIPKDLLREGIDAAYEFGSIVSIDFAFVVGYHFLHRRGDIVFIQRQNEHFVIAEQIPLYCFAKTNTVDLFTKQPGIIH